MRLYIYIGMILLLLGALLLPSSNTQTAISAPGDNWAVKGIRLTNASPIPNLIPASPQGMNVGTASYPVRNVVCINMTMTGTYAVDDLAATDDLTVGDDSTFTDKITVGGTGNFTGLVTTNALTSNTTVTAGNVVSSGPVNGTVGTFSTSTNTITDTSTNATTTNSSITSPMFGTQNFSANATLGATSAMYVLVDTSGGNRTATVNTSASAGRTWVFIDNTSSWDATHALAINVTSGGNINGAATYSSTTANGSVRVMCDGAGNYRTW